MAKILVVDDQRNMRTTLALMLKGAGHDVEEAPDGDVAIDRVGAEAFDLVLTDLKMGTTDGITVLRHVKEASPLTEVIVMTAFATIESAVEAMRLGAYDYIQKPFKPDEVVLALRKAEERELLRRENQALRAEIRKEHQFQSILAKSASMQVIFRTIGKIADFKTTVLVTGESGVGKELVARAVHEAGNRQGKPFVAVNCGAIPENLLESELFGHKKGAFTDAHQDRKGLFEQAHTGTLFLDEIGELPLGLQVKLLRVLEDNSIRRLGETRDVAVDVRIVTATHRDLQSEAKAGRFRDDLYYRLNVLPIHIPPLRERKDDIPLLIDHFIARNNARLGTHIRGFDTEARRILYEYSWPGNVRELENTIERAMVLADGDQIIASDLPERIREAQDQVKVQLNSGELSIKKMTRVIEEILIRRALQKTKGNRTRAAEVLEISHRAVLYKIKEYEITDL